MSIRRPLELDHSFIFPSDDDLQVIAAEQRRELVAAKAVESDLDLAFNIQLQEAINASLSLNPNQPSSSTTSASLPQPQLNSQQLDDDFPSFTDLQSDELLKLEQEFKDHIISESEFRKLKDDYHRMIHDRRVACEIAGMPEDEWEEWGDNFEKPFGEGTSKGVNSETFRVYFKSIMENFPNGTIIGGIGVAICDSKDNLLFELQKPLVGDGKKNRRCADIQSLIEGLNAAIELDLKRVVFYCDYYPTFQFVTGRWPAKQPRLSALVNQVALLRKRFTYSQPIFAPRNDIKFAFKLARDAIVSQVTKPAESSGSRNLRESCVICLEDTNINEIFSINGCAHRYCFSCMKQHIEAKLLNGMLPKCPHEGCNTELKIDACRKFLTPRLIEIMNQRIKEASIPVTEKVYCPYPKCSALMSKLEVLENSRSARTGAYMCGHRVCIKCNGHFCINCKVPWHYNMTCFEYKRSNPYPQQEEAKLKRLAATNLWRQCVKCNHMIELAAGCYHMTCRCGHEFCYTCGTEWKNKAATCSCPLWDEENILEDEDDEDEDEDEEEDYESEEEDYFMMPF